MRVLTVGCGFVGAELARELVAEGHRVHGLRRSEAPLPAGVTPLRVDVNDEASLRAALPADIDHLVYAAAPSPPSTLESYQSTYVDGLARVLNALADVGAPVRRAVFTSSTAVYAQDDGSFVDEDSPAEAPGKGALLRDAERVLLEGPFPGTVLRLAGIYGPGRDRMVRAVREGSARCVHPARFGNRIHQRDCAGAIHHLLTHPSPDSLYLGVDSAPVDLCEVFRWLAGELGVAPPPEVDEREIPAAQRGTRKRVSNARLLASGYSLRVPRYREGMLPR